jgi:hypothetical protein
VRCAGGDERRSAAKANLGKLKLGGTIIANSDGFDKKNLRLAGYIDRAGSADRWLAGQLHLHAWT